MVNGNSSPRAEAAVLGGSGQGVAGTTSKTRVCLLESSVGSLVGSQVAQHGAILVELLQPEGGLGGPFGAHRPPLVQFFRYNPDSLNVCLRVIHAKCAGPRIHDPR